MIWLRSAVFNVWFVGATIAYGSAGIPVRLLAPHRALALAQAWARAVLAGARVICGIRAEVSGQEHLPEGAALIASQHQSAFDTIVWLRLVPRASYVYKSELARLPLFGPLLRPAGQIELDREAGFAAIKSLLRQAERAAADGRQIVMFPEGTRVRHGSEGAVLPGISAVAARAKLPIIPVATDSGRLWGRRAFVKRPGVIHIVIEPPIAMGLGQAGTLAALKSSWAAGSKRVPACG